MSKNLLPAQARLPRAPQLLAGSAAGIALLGVVGWLSGMHVLAGGWSTYVPMAPSTAIAFLLLAGALFCFARWPALQLSRRICLIAVSIVFLLGLLVLAQFIFGIDLGVEQVLSGTNKLLGSTPLGRMSPLSAVAFLFESTTLFLLTTKRWRHASTAAVLLAAATIAFNAVVLVGYAFGVPLLSGGTFIPVALPTALAFVLVGLGQFYLAAPGVTALRDWSAASMRGILLRAFLPFMLLFVLFNNLLDARFSSMLAANPAVWDSLIVLAASVLIIVIIGWIARRTGTEIESAQAALAESEEHYRLLFENSGEAILLSQPDGTIYAVNPEACRMFGRSPDEIIKHGRDGIIDRNDPRLQMLLEERRTTGKFKGEINLVRSDGTIFPGDISTMVFKDSSGAERTSMVIRDLSERQRAQESLQQSLQQITHGRSTLQALHLAAQAAQRAHTPEDIYRAMGAEIKKLGFEMLVFDLDAEKREISASFMTYAEGLVRTAETLIGLSRKTYRIPVIPGGYYDQLLSAGKAVLYSDATPITAEILPAQLRPLANQVLNLLGTRRGIYATLVIEDQPQGFLIIMGSELGEVDLPAMDLLAAQVSVALENARLFQAVQLELNERKRADAALRESEKRFRALIENSSDAITLLDARGVVVYDSAAAPRMLGYGPDELIGQSAFTLIHPTDLPIVQDVFLKLAETPGERASAIFRVRHKSGTWVWLETVATNLLSEPGVMAIVLNYRDITQRIRDQERSEQQFKHLIALSEIDRAISSSFDLQLGLDTLLVHAIVQLGVDATDVLLFDSGSHTLEYAAGQGFHAQPAPNTPIHLSKGHAARVILNQRPLYIPDLEKQPDDSPRSALFVSENFKSYYAVPLRAKGELNGVLEIFQRSLLEPGTEWLDFLNTLAGQAGIAIDNASLFKGLQQSNAELSRAYEATIEGWSHALDLRDKETEGHSQRVTHMTLYLAKTMGLDADELVQIRRGALLHDIGKMGVPDQILLKPGALTDEEWTIMRKHPEFAYKLLSPIAYLQPALDIPYCHHEKWDGTGYPRGLQGEQIPLAARIFAVVDIWDALHSDRPYRPAWPAEKVREHIRSLSGSHLDPRVVTVFLESNIATRYK